MSLHTATRPLFLCMHRIGPTDPSKVVDILIPVSEHLHCVRHVTQGSVLFTPDMEDIHVQESLEEIIEALNHAVRAPIGVVKVGDVKVSS